MAEWSKAVDLSLHDKYSTGEIRVGSNPTGTIIFGRVESIFFLWVLVEETLDGGHFTRYYGWKETVDG